MQLYTTMLNLQIINQINDGVCKYYYVAIEKYQFSAVYCFSVLPPKVIYIPLSVSSTIVVAATTLLDYVKPEVLYTLKECLFSGHPHNARCATFSEGKTYMSSSAASRTSRWTVVILGIPSPNIFDLCVKDDKHLRRALIYTT